MRENSDQLLLEYIKSQVSLFLKEMDDFYPFGVAIGSNEEIIPLAAYLEESELSVKQLLIMLEKHINETLSTGRFVQAAIALSVSINNDSGKLDAVQIRLYELDMPIEITNHIYSKTKSSIKFN